MAYSALERVTNLLTLLLETRVPLTLRQIAGEMAGMYPVSTVALRGAFERDKALLRELGVPIDTVVLGGDQAGETGYSIDRARFELRDLRLDDDERRALQAAAAMLRSETGQDAMWKLGGSVLAGSAVVANVQQLADLPALRAAIDGRHPLRFHYRDVERTVDGYGLLLREGFWYLIGRDHGRDEVRTYRVDRIDGAVDTVSTETFVRPDGFDVRSAFPSDAKALGDDGDRRTARVAVHGQLAAIVRGELGEGAVESVGADGVTTFAVPCANLEAFRSWVLGLGAHAEVLGPADVRAHVVGWLRQLAGRGGAT